MEFTFRDQDTLENNVVPDAIGYPSDANCEFIIRDPHYGDHVAYQILFPVVPESSLRPALETGDESKLREHIQPQEDPGWFRLVNIVGYAAIKTAGGASGSRSRVPRRHSSTTILVKVRDFKETGPYFQSS